ncbi:uncharacterized protein LOC130923249 [Corythoichthys intestinalis]|uniref:uncharacterized protein LOC130923249 n=1 Tax=Corythoichthys intestinalis TaxID=161448 RepID=UPI0025A5F417|nr:uncharacterized protein LOC130923249 [Corythoichthys intestinalis]
MESPGMNCEKGQSCCFPRRTRHLFHRVFFCCSCLQNGEEDHLQEQEKKNEEPLQVCDKDTIHITVEDLGIVNTSFCLSDEQPVSPRNKMGRSASSVSTCPRALMKKRVQHLSSLPLQPQARQICSSSSWEEIGDDDEEEHFLFGSGDNSTPASGSLLAHCEINLIPPTPSDVIEDDQFFDINSEESMVYIAESRGSCHARDYEENMEAEEATLELTDTENIVDKATDSEEGNSDQLPEERETIKDEDEEKPKAMLSRVYQVDPVPVLQHKRNFNTGIKLLPFTELNLDDLSKSDVSCSDMLKIATVRPPLQASTMDAFTHQRRPITRSCSLRDTESGCASSHTLTQNSDQQQQGNRSPRQRRITLASCLPKCKDQNGNIPGKTADRQEAKSLRERNTNETCQWFTSIGLQKCLPFIQEANLCGADIASIDVNILDTLHINTLKEKEQLLSAIYNELHPPNTCVGSFRFNHVEENLTPMIKSKSSPHVNCLSMSRPSLRIRHNNQNGLAQRNSHLIEVTINASERIVHLRTPKETTICKIIDSCLRMLGMTDDRSLFSLKEQKDSTAELSQEQQIGSLLTSPSDRQLELHLCKRNPTSQNSPEVNRSSGIQKEDRIRELNLQVESLQNVILQVQELHLGLVAFCSELKNSDGDGNLEMLGSAALEQKLKVLHRRLTDKRESLHTLREHINNTAAHRKKQLDVRLLEKMKLNCQVFKEEISMVHLNRQVAHLQNVLQDSYIKESTQRKNTTIGSLSQLVSPQSPAMLMVFQEQCGPGGCFGFTCCYTEGIGLVVVKVENSQLCVDDRLVEVNGSPVVNSTEEELCDLLLHLTSAQIIVLRQTPATLTSHQPPLILQHVVKPNPLQAERDVIAMETPSLRKLMAI